MAKDRMAGLDALRFAAAALVMLFHFTAADQVFGTAHSALVGDLYPELTCFGFGWVGVQIFFVISGIVISYSAERSSAAQFARSRILRLVPAAWLCAPLSALAVMAYGLMPGAGKAMLKSMLFWPFGGWIDPVYWTLPVEIVFYAAVWGLLVWKPANNPQTALRGLALALGSLSTAYWLTAMVWAPHARWQGMRLLELILLYHGVYFALGILIYQSRRLPMPPIAALFMVAGAVQIAIVAEGNGQPVFPPVAIWLVGLLCALWAVHAPIKSTPVLGFLGLSTYPLYLLHDYVGLALTRYMLDCGFNRWVILVWDIGIVLNLSAWVVFCELPLRRWLGRLLTCSRHDMRA